MKSKLGKGEERYSFHVCLFFLTMQIYFNWQEINFPQTMSVLRDLLVFILAHKLSCYIFFLFSPTRPTEGEQAAVWESVC